LFISLLLTSSLLLLRREYQKGSFVARNFSLFLEEKLKFFLRKIVVVWRGLKSVEELQMQERNCPLRLRDTQPAGKYLKHFPGSLF